MSERGFLRSGTRYAARNNPYYTSARELLLHHQRLLQPEPAVSTRAVRIANTNSGSLLQTTVRFAFEHRKTIAPVLRDVFIDLFREHSESASSGFEVVVTFNAVLTNERQTSFSLFYGHDHRALNASGAFGGLRHGDTYIVRSLLDLNAVPTSFDPEELVRNHRGAFQDSGVHVHSFVSVVYLIYRYLEV